jgi:hypothetical protein
MSGRHVLGEATMRDRNEKKIAVEDLREPMGGGRQKPKAAGDGDVPTTESKTVIRLDHSRLLKIEADNSIVEQVAMADVITARTHSNEREERLFKRPRAELEAPGLPYNVHTLQFSVPNVKDLRFLTQVIGRIKQVE